MIRSCPESAPTQDPSPLCAACQGCREVCGGHLCFSNLWGVQLPSKLSCGGTELSVSQQSIYPSAPSIFSSLQTGHYLYLLAKFLPAKTQAQALQLMFLVCFIQPFFGFPLMFYFCSFAQAFKAVCSTPHS